ncbi:unnamed protein product [Closterium sp. Naga37s-1]|nr:unnamed protein product [Closterium sp. Naga37s-1]
MQCGDFFPHACRSHPVFSSWQVREESRPSIQQVREVLMSAVGVEGGEVYESGSVVGYGDGESDTTMSHLDEGLVTRRAADHAALESAAAAVLAAVAAGGAARQTLEVYDGRVHGQEQARQQEGEGGAGRSVASAAELVATYGTGGPPCPPPLLRYSPTANCPYRCSRPRNRLLNEPPTNSASSTSSLLSGAQRCRGLGWELDEEVLVRRAWKEQVRQC